MLEVFPVLPLIGSVSLGVGALSYAGTFTIGITADRAAYPDLEVFAASVRGELDALAASARGTSILTRPDFDHARVSGGYGRDG